MFPIAQIRTEFVDHAVMRIHHRHANKRTIALRRVKLDHNAVIDRRVVGCDGHHLPDQLGGTDQCPQQGNKTNFQVLHGRIKKGAPPIPEVSGGASVYSNCSLAHQKHFFGCNHLIAVAHDHVIEAIFADLTSCSATIPSQTMRARYLAPASERDHFLA
jgi:hypothetical protein